MLTYTYLNKGKFGFVEKAKPQVLEERDAVVERFGGGLPFECRSAEFGRCRRRALPRYVDS